MSASKPYANAKRVLARLFRWLEAEANDVLFPSVYVLKPVAIHHDDVCAAHRRSAGHRCTYEAPSRRSAS
jgi:hypothetical protein